jgi:hypothetical protein
MPTRAQRTSPPSDASIGAQLDWGSTGYPERRNEARAQVRWAGAVIAGSRVMVCACVIENLSAGGARVAIDQDVDLPAMVTLLVERQNLALEAEVIWQQGRQAGLAFAG